VVILAIELLNCFLPQLCRRRRRHSGPVWSASAPDLFHRAFWAGPRSPPTISRRWRRRQRTALSDRPGRSMAPAPDHGTCHTRMNGRAEGARPDPAMADPRPAVACPGPGRRCATPNCKRHVGAARRRPATLSPEVRSELHCCDQAFIHIVRGRYRIPSTRLRSAPGNEHTHFPDLLACPGWLSGKSASSRSGDGPKICGPCTRVAGRWAFRDARSFLKVRGFWSVRITW